MSANGLKNYNVFLASSKELQADRESFAAAILEFNQDIRDRNISFSLKKWDNHSSSFAGRRKQEEYNEDINGCDLFVMLYWSKVGKYTLEEFQRSEARLQDKSNFRVLVLKNIKPVPRYDDSVAIFERSIKNGNGDYVGKYESGAELKFTIKQELQKLINEGIFEGIRSTYRKANYIPKDDDFSKAQEVLRTGKVLIVEGVSGAGKTEFTKYFLGSREHHKRLAWIDCAESTPSSQDIATILSSTLVDARHEASMADSLPAVTESDISLWFEGTSPKYLVLDDFDNLIPDNSDKVHWLAGNFLGKCLESPDSPYIILIHKFQKSKNYLEHLFTNANVRSKKNIKLLNANVTIKLGYLTDDESVRYVSGFNGISGDERILRLVKSTSNWMPIQLQIIVSELIERRREDNANLFGNSRQFLSDIEAYLEEREESRSPKDDQERDRKFTDFLLTFLFKRIQKIDQLNSNTLLMDTALAASVLQKYSQGRNPLNVKALGKMVSSRQSIPEGAIKTTLYRLETLNLLKSLHSEGSYTFEHDTKLNFAFEKLDNSEFSPGKKKSFLHFNAGKWYEDSFYDGMQDTKAAEFGSWHYANAGRYDRSLTLLNLIDKDLRLDFRYLDLEELRTRNLVESINQILGCDAILLEDKVWINHARIKDADALNLADLAEVYFQGLDKWKIAEHFAITVIKLFENNKHSHLQAYVQAGHLVSILNFETAISAKQLAKIFKQQFSDVNPQNQCVEIAEYLLATYLGVNLTDVYKGVYHTETIKDKAVAANVANSLGVFQNRAENYERAIHAYRYSIMLLGEIERLVITNRDSLREGSVEKWRTFIERDKMCAHSNLSRSLLLQEGPENAIAYFEINLSDWYPEGAQLSQKSQPYWSSQEYNYALINISYYYLCKGDLVKARKWWDKCQEPPGESWLKLTKNQMDCVLNSFEIGEGFDVDGFKVIAEQFALIPDPRGQLFSEFNGVAHEISQLKNGGRMVLSVQEIKHKLIAQRELAVAKVYYSAAKIITYTYNEFIKLREVIEIEGELDVLEPLEEWPVNWQAEVLCCVGDLMTSKNRNFAYGPWRAPMLMAGILLMRSKPFAPNDDEIEGATSK